MVQSEVRSPKSVAEPHDPSTRAPGSLDSARDKLAGGLHGGEAGVGHYATDWRVLVESDRLSATAQMARDVELAWEDIPTVRFFCWQLPAVSLGWKQPHPAWLDETRGLLAGLEAVERPTGGGMAFHGSDVSVSIIVPRAVDLPVRMLMSAVCDNTVRLCRHYGAQAAPMLESDAAKRITYCLTDLSPYAVFAGGHKVAGFALRRFPHTWLIQGSLLVRPLPANLAQAIPAEVRSQLHTRAISLAEAAQRPVHEADVVEQWSRHWPTWWTDAV